MRRTKRTLNADVRRLLFETLEQRQLLAADVLDAPLSSLWSEQLHSQSLVFEPNVGQAAPEIAMAARIADGSITLGADFAEVHHGRGHVRMDVVGANPDAMVSGQTPSAQTTHYYLGELHATAGNYHAATVHDAYPGVDVTYYGSTANQLEFDFIVAPFADPNVIRLAFPGAHVSATDEGLAIASEGEAWTLAAPVSYQLDANGETRWIDSQFVLHADGSIQFEVDPYDITRELIIDPVFSTQMATFLGGAGDESPQDLLVVGNDVYITGATTSAQFASGSAVTNQDAFLAKLNDELTQIQWVTFFGGAGDDAAYGLDLDANGDIVIAGGTTSANLPLLNAIQQNLAGGMDAFFATISPAGALLQSTPYGGVGDDMAESVATGASGEVYLAGKAAAGFPTQSALQTAPHGVNAGFLTGFENHGQSVAFSTFIGGSASADERAHGVAVAGNGAVTVVGTTADATLTTAQPMKATLSGPTDAFVWQVTADGSQLLSGSYLGGATSDFGYDVALAPNNDDIVIAGQIGTGGDDDNGSAAAWRLNSDANQLQWTQTWGGTATDSARAVVVDPQGNAVLAGVAFDGSFGFTKIDSLDPAEEPDGNHALIARIAPTGQLRFSSLFGDAGHDAGLAVGVGSQGMYLAGETTSTNLATVGAAQTTSNGSLDGFAALIVDSRWDTLPLDRLGQLEQYAVDTVRYFTSSESNNLLAGLTHSWFGQGPYQTCTAVGQCTEAPTDIARGFGSHVVMNEATLGFNVLMVALKMGWLDFMPEQQHYQATVGQVIRGLETLRGLQTSGDQNKFIDNTFYRSYITTPNGADNDLPADQIVRDSGVNIRTSDDNGLSIHNLLILRGLADDPLVDAADREKIRDLVDAIVGDIRLSAFRKGDALAFELKWDEASSQWVQSNEVWDREVGEGAQILAAMLLTGEIDVPTFLVMADELLNFGPTNFDGTPRGTIRVETPGFHSAMFQHGLRAFHGFPVTPAEYEGATFFEDSLKPTAEYQVEFARDNNLASLGTQVMTADLNGYQLTRQAAHPNSLARFPGNEFKEDPVYNDTMSRATAAHGMVVPLARFREMNPSDIVQLMDWLEAYEAGFYRSGSDTELGFQAEIPHHPTDTTYTWMSQRDQQLKYADGGVTYDALDSAYTVLSIFDAFNPDAPLSSYHAMAQRTGEIAAYLDTTDPIDAEMFADAGVEIQPAATASIEEGASAQYTVRLTSKPLADVTIALDGQGQLMTHVNSLTFTPDNWDQTQQVTVTAIDDYAIENVHFAEVQMSFASNDYYYDTLLGDGAWTVRIDDNEVSPTNISLDNQIIPEDLSGAEIANVTVTDADQASGHSITLSDSRFEFNGGVIRLAPDVSLSRDSVTTIDLEVTATDASGFSFPKVFQLSVVGIGLAGGQVSENVAGATTGTLGLSIPIGPVQWMVDDSRFEVSGDVLKLKPAETLNFEAEPTVPVTVTGVAASDSRLTFTKVFQLVTIDANDDPTNVSLDAMTIFENHVGAAVGNASAIDEDASDAHTFSTTDQRFTFDGTLLKLQADQWLTDAGPIQVPVTATDSADATFTKQLTIDVLAHPFPWQNPRNAFDVNDDDVANIGDLRITFVSFVANGGGDLPPLEDGTFPPPYWDVLGDNVFNLSDVRNLFTVLVDGPSSEGESERWGGVAAPVSSTSRLQASAEHNENFEAYVFNDDATETWDGLSTPIGANADDGRPLTRRQLHNRSRWVEEVFTKWDETLQALRES